jgi:OOP family OmpA-OmpF porin
VDTGAESATLDKLSEEIKSTNAKAVIEGYTDSKGTEANNKVLSLDRAIVVKRELKKRGVNGDRLRAVGMGESQPVATNDTAAGRAQNRRVEVKIFANQ